MVAVRTGRPVSPVVMAVMGSGPFPVSTPPAVMAVMVVTAVVVVPGVTAVMVVLVPRGRVTLSAVPVVTAVTAGPGVPAVTAAGVV